MLVYLGRIAYWTISRSHPLKLRLRALGDLRLVVLITRGCRLETNADKRRTGKLEAILLDLAA